MSRIASCLQSVAAVTVAALFVFPAVAAEPKPKLPNLDSALSTAAPTILKKLRDRHYENVGVLKFLVAEDKGEPRSNVGSLNRTLADRLEVALALTNDDPAFGIIARASEAVGSNPRANILDPDGRAELFKIRANKFSVPWKPKQPIKPDAFLTGTATLSPDRSTITVKVVVCDRNNLEKKDLDTLLEFTAANDTRTLTEIGLTYRGDPTDRQLALFEKTAPTAEDKPSDLKKKADEALKILEDSPVQLEILYDNQPQTPTAEPGIKNQTNALLSVSPPPVTTKTVTFRLTNRTKKNITYGVVLRMNGFSTIFKEEQDARKCMKWILEPGQSVTITGFQENEKVASQFKVAAPTQSQLTSISNYENLGTIDLILFRGLPKPDSAIVEKDPDKEDTKVAAIGRGAMVLGKEPPATDLKAFQAQLKGEGAEKTARGRKGGLLQEGTTGEPNPIKKVEFYPSQEPELSTTIRYYKLGN